MSVSFISISDSPENARQFPFSLVNSVMASDTNEVDKTMRLPLLIAAPIRTTFRMKCDDGDSMKLETLQKLVGGPIKPVPALLSAEWAREKDVDGILLLVNEEGLMKERPLTNQRASEMTAAELVGPAVVAAKRGDELIGFAKPVVETICAEWL